MASRSAAESKNPAPGARLDLRILTEPPAALSTRRRGGGSACPAGMSPPGGTGTKQAERSGAFAAFTNAPDLFSASRFYLTGYREGWSTARGGECTEATFRHGRAPSVSFADSSPGGGAKGDTSSVIRRTVTRRMTPSPQGEGFVWPLREQSLWRRPELAATPSVTAACRRNSSLREGADRFPSFSPVLLIDGESGLCYIVSIILPKGV